MMWSYGTTSTGWNAPPGHSWFDRVPQPPATYTKPRVRVYEVLDGDDDVDDAWRREWHWCVSYYRDRSGRRTTIMPRWGQANRWEDALAGALAALANEYADFSALWGSA